MASYWPTAACLTGQMAANVLIAPTKMAALGCLRVVDGLVVGLAGRQAHKRGDVGGGDGWETGSIGASARMHVAAAVEGWGDLDDGVHEVDDRV